MIKGSEMARKMPEGSIGMIVHTMIRQIRLLSVTSIATLSMLAHSAALSPFEGVWRTVDDRLGYSNALVRIVALPDGTLEGRIIKTLPRPDGKTALNLCTKCTGTEKNKPITEVRLMWNLVPDPKNPNFIKDGRVLDPYSGRVYHGTVRLIGNGNRMLLRGYVGISVLGRSQIWLRETEASAESMMHSKTPIAR